MKVVLGFVFALAVVAAVVGAQQSEPVTFSHQIRQFVMKGDDTEKVDMSVTFNGDGVVFTPKRKGRDPIAVSYESISSMVYDRRSRVRKMAHNWGKAEDHFLTIQYKTPAGQGDFIEFEMGKDTAPRVLATIEARSGKKVERSSGS